MARKKIWPCFVCEKLYAELEEAEVCERSHTREREKYEDDGREYGHPDDMLDELREY